MVTIGSLWLPILLSAVLVFVVSSVIHMVLKYHATNFRPVPDEDGLMDAMRPFGLAPGEYVVPFSGGPEAMKSPEFQEKVNKGPVALLTVWPPGPPAMGKSLVLWFLYSVVLGLFAAYLTSRALEPGAAYLAVFRFSGTVAFLGYAAALWQNTIWYRRSVTTTLKSTMDGLIYGLVTGGVFGWLWPGA